MKMRYYPSIRGIISRVLHLINEEIILKPLINTMFFTRKDIVPILEQVSNAELTAEEAFYKIKQIVDSTLQHKRLLDPPPPPLDDKDEELLHTIQMIEEHENDMSKATEDWPVRFHQTSDGYTYPIFGDDVPSEEG